MIGQLIWKEWREHRWKMAMVLLVLLVPMLAIWWRSHYDYVPLITPVVLLASWIVPIWIAAWTATGERLARTEGLLRGLPARPGVVIAVKGAWGIATVLLPTAIGLAALARLWDDPSGTERWGNMSVVILSCSVHLYVMVLALTMRVQREGIAVALGVLVVLGCALWVSLAVGLMGDSGSFAPIRPWLLGNPFAVLMDMSYGPGADGLHADLPWAPLTTQWAMIAGWGVVAAWRHSQLGGPGRGARSPASARRDLAWKMAPAGSRLRALIWSEWRQQRGVLIAACLTLFGVSLLVAGLVGRDARPRRAEVFAQAFVMAMGMFGQVLAVVVAVMLGVSTMSGDLEPRVMNFWRSRPLKAGSLFWTKFLVALGGAGALLAIMEATVFAGSQVYLLMLGWPTQDYPAYAIQQAVTESHRLLAGNVILLPLALVLAMFWGIIVRQTIYAVSLSAIAIVAVLLIPFDDDLNTVGSALFGGPSHGFFVLTAVACIVVTIGLAFLSQVALQRDWHIGSRAG